jgi:hypothetical protein
VSTAGHQPQDPTAWGIDVLTGLRAGVDEVIE